ncbi:MAG: NAD-glutamate dehydrogenase [Rhodomicrobium sp.]|nr:MAG: NAD-glutamate dehydrogenase [Rhodomicrobium sp.]
MATQSSQQSYDPIVSISSSIGVPRQMSKSLDQFTAELLASIKWTDYDAVPEEIYKVLVEQCFAFVQQRPVHQSKLMIDNHKFVEDSNLAYDSFTVINLLNDDVPFLLDSVLGELQARGITVHMVLHPIITVKRDSTGKLLSLHDAMEQGGPDIHKESFISLHVEELSSSVIAELETALMGLMKRVQMVVQDWLPMRNRLTSVASGLSNNTVKVSLDQLSESIQFLRWALDNNFTFLGMREYVLKGKSSTAQLKPKKGTGLGMLRDVDMKVLRRGKELSHMTPEVRKFFFSPEPIIIAKANIKSDIHRRSYMDYIGVKLYNQSGELAGELRVVGLFTSSAYSSRVSTIPLLRQKLDFVLDTSGSARESHTGKALTNIIETFPRDELFQISNMMLASYAKEIETLDHAPRVKVLKRVDEFDRFVSLLVYMPRDRFSTTIRENVGEFLAKQYNGRVSAFYPYFAEAPYVRIHYIIGRDTGKTPQRSTKLLEEGIREISRRWEDRMQVAISEIHEGDETDILLEQYRSAFPVGYQENYGTERLLDDIHIIEEMDENRPTAVAFHSSSSGKREQVEVTLYNLGEAIPLSRRVPIFENLGFNVIDERSYMIVPDKGEGQPPVCQHIMRLETRSGAALNLDTLRVPLTEAFMAVWSGRAADDRYNELITLTAMPWQDAAIIRGLSHYLRQINVPYDQSYLSQVMVRYPQLARKLIELFHARFDPQKQKTSSRKVKALSNKIEAALEDIPSLDEDQIIRHFRNLMMAMLRTNVYQLSADAEEPQTMAFKFDSHQVEGMPEPCPFREIFVYSPKVEGVHLRFGKVARGGLRWSDRPQDFRTEVLGLVKAQLVKNSVIVPTGSKGGFVPKDMPDEPSREEFMAYGIKAYKAFISGLLSITDNLEGKKIIPPQNTVRYDDDDPYLVVAADKGTASFSDIANEISTEHGFWLGDAFASGGSQGYDHKKMGITARGAFEAVKRHFREMDINIEQDPYTVIGVGDMSGDVFGNGMLLSKATKLVAAFDHRDIFIDPNPNPKTSFTERKRLFDIGRSSWQDYNKKLISKGGGVFSRSLKSIPLSDEMRALLKVEAKALSPNELLKAVLRAEADLLWFGGIGTYVRGSSESNADVGDRANDIIRVGANELNVKVIGEGANLGITQAGRMDFAADGGRVNTDAIDNSAGVNSSDLEVNIKIALGQAVSAGRLTGERRNKVLSSMTDAVASRCLVNNYRQSLSLTLDQTAGLSDIGFQQRLMRELEAKGLMNRAIEELPDDVALAERIDSGASLSRPELATLTGFAKIDLFNSLAEQEIIEDPFFNEMLKDYFPAKMQKDFARDIRSHPLRREIIATQLTNDIINRGGVTMALRLLNESGRESGDLAMAYSMANAVLELDDCFAAMDALDNKIPSELQIELYSKLRFITQRKTAWFLSNGDVEAGLRGEIKAYKAGLKRYTATLNKRGGTKQSAAKTGAGESRGANGAIASAEVDALVSRGLPIETARMIAKLSLLSEGLDVVLAARRAELDVAKLTVVDQALDGALHLGALMRAAENVPVVDVYDRWALNALVSRVQAARRELQIKVGMAGSGFEDWAETMQPALSRAGAGITEILDSGDVSLSKLIVAVGQVDELGR